jgi:HlyD family secretion protein
MNPTNLRRRTRASVLVKVLIATGGVAGAGVTLYAVAPSAAPAKNGPHSTDLARADVISFDITTTATGDIQAKNQIEIRSELDTESAIIELAAEGTFVKAGDLLIKLNGDQIQSQIDDVTLTVESSRADLVAAENAYEIQKSENESKLRQAQLKVDLAKLALEQWLKGEVVQKKQDLALALDNTAKELERLQEKYERSLNLNKEGFLSKNELQLDEIALRKARADRDKAVLDEKTYLEYQYPKDQKSKVSDVEEAQAELERVTRQNEIQLTSKDADRLNKQRQLAMRLDRLKKLQTQLSACTMHAPTDGLVVYATSAGRNWDDTPFQVGRQVRPRETLIVLPDTSVMMAVVRVHESLAGKIRPGQTASVKIDMLGGQMFQGRVDSVGVMAETGDRWRDPNRREYSVRIALEKGSEDTSLRPSMRCEATITLGRVDSSLAVPIQAVFASDQLRYVYVPSAGKYERVPVKVGQRSDTFAQILAGLEAGQRVLLREPAAGEISPAPWNEAQLKLVGFELGEDGTPVAVRSDGDRGGSAQGAPPGAAGPGAASNAGRRGRGPGAPGDRPTPDAGRPNRGPIGDKPPGGGGAPSGTGQADSGAKPSDRK